MSQYLLRMKIKLKAFISKYDQDLLMLQMVLKNLMYVFGGKGI